MSKSNFLVDYFEKVSELRDQECLVSDAPTAAQVLGKWWATMDRPLEAEQVVCNRCSRCGSYVGHAGAGCLTCGKLALELAGTQVNDVHSAAVRAAQESAEAVIAVARYLDSLECDADDPLSVIRRQTHAPLRRALNKALDAMTELHTENVG